MYWNNVQSFNPGATGTAATHFGSVFSRQEWAGYEWSPWQIGASYAFRWDSLGAGIGTTIQYDEVSNERNFRAELNYSQHFSLGAGELGVGASVGIFRKEISWTFLSPEVLSTTQYEPLLAASGGPEMELTVDAGIFYHTDNLEVGISTTQLNEASYDEFRYELVRQYYVYGGYLHELNDNWAVQPNVLARTDGSFTQINVSTRVWYKSMVYLGVGYHAHDALFPMVGYRNNFVEVSYGYDVTTTETASSASGSHEIMLSIFFD